MSKNLLDGPKEYKKDIDNIDKILYKILDDIKKQTIFLSSQNVDRLISLGEVVGDDWEIIENERCDEITFSESDLNLIELAQAPKTSNKKSKQDTSLFKVRYQYAGSKKGERDFCNKVIEADKVYREEDLNANYNYNEELSPSGTDSYNIFLFKGGVNCKHWWQRVVYLKKGNDRISVNQARKMILELDPKDRKEASFDKNDKRVAKVAEAQNNYWSLTPNYRDSGVELSAKSKELYQRLAGFDPNQKRGEDGKWGSGGCHKKPLKFDELMDQKDQTEKLIEYTTYGSENQYKRTVWIDWFLGENEESKSRIANEIDNDPELERAMKSALYDFWKTESEEGLKSNVSFDDFQDMEINLYRGVSERNKETGTINENGFTSFALTKRLASGFGEVKEFKKKVSDLYGAVNIVGGEIEVLEPQPYSDEFAKKLGIKNSKTYAKELNKDQIKEYFKIIDKKGRNCANFYADNILKENSSVKLAGFDPNQKRGADGKWGSGGCTFEDWFGNSKIVDSSGEPLEVYHGSTHDFTEFSNVRGNIENDMGIGFYFSSSLDDVTANYDDTDGPDLQGRIEILAERLENDLEVSYEEARKKAEKKLSGGKTNIIKAFISMNNPLTIGGENDTFLDYNYSEEDGESGLLVDFFENYRMAAAGFYDVEPDRVFEGIEIYDGMMASDFVKAIKANEALAYATDEYGNMASNEILRNTFELMGFDGIVDNTVSRFNMDGVNEDTKHIIAFKPNQIKSVKNKSWCREENNINLSSTKTQKNK